MRRDQPDNRVHPHELGMWVFGNKRFVVNLRRGVPYNACVEEHKKALRCWASYNYLDHRAATAVDNHATKTEKGTFIWDDDVQRGALVRTQGNHQTFKVIIP